MKTLDERIGDYLSWKKSHHKAAEIINELRLRVEETRKIEDHLIDSRDRVYSERNKVVAALSKVFPAWLDEHQNVDSFWDQEWKNIVYINLPTGQVSWHIHASELQYFAHLKSEGDPWDGHTTEEKYARLEKLTMDNSLYANPTDTELGAVASVIQDNISDEITDWEDVARAAIEEFIIVRRGR